MKEIEVKILEIDRASVEGKIRQLGAVVQFDGKMRNTFFDFPDQAIQKSNKVIRLRTKGPKSVFAFKKLLSQEDAKICEELEVTVSNFDEMKEILESIGLGMWSDMQKHRTSYRISGAQFEFDRYLDPYQYIPEFLEIEAKDTTTLFDLVQRLGFQKKDCLSWSTRELIQHYSR
jgi:predicted adenylyl cyclase CyaB